MALMKGEKIVNGMFWTGLEIFLKKIVSTIITILLARILSAEDYGLIALTTIFIAFAAVFTQNGFNIAIIRKKVISDKDISTVHIANIFFSFILYLIIIFMAPYVALFYSKPVLANVLRAMGGIIVIQAFSISYRAVALRNGNFKMLSISSTISSVVSGIFGVLLATLGCGVWSLVTQQLMAAVLDAIFLVILCKVKIRPYFSIECFREMFTFSIGTVGTAFIDFLGNNFSNALIGKKLSAEKLGLYNKGVLLPEVIGLNIYSIMNTTLLPALSSDKYERELFKQRVQKYIIITTYIMLPIMMGLLLVSEEVIILLLTEKWIAILPVMQCFCISYMINPYRAITYNALYVLGESQKTLCIEMIRCLFTVVGSWIVLQWLNLGITGIAIFSTIELIFISCGALFYITKYLELEQKLIIKNIIQTIIITFFMLLAVCAVKIQALPIVIKLILEISVGTTTFFSLSIALNNESFFFMMSYINKIFTKR